MFLSVVVPAYNEEQNIERTIGEFISYLNTKNYDYEIIIVNDGSIDNTSQICHELAQGNESIKFIDNKINRGKGYTVREGFKNAKGDYMMFIDADNATSINHLDMAQKFMDKGFGLIIGSRSPHDAEGAYQKEKQVYWKRMLGLYGNLFIRKLVGEEIRDTQCGFKILKKDFAQSIIPKLLIERWGFDVEYIMLARLRKVDIGIVPVVWNNSDMSRVGIQGYFRAFHDILRIKINMKNKRYEID